MSFRLKTSSPNIKRMDPIITRGFMLKSTRDSHKSASKGEGYVSIRPAKK
jgi:hypothetical protein